MIINIYIRASDSILYLIYSVRLDKLSNQNVIADSASPKHRKSVPDLYSTAGEQVTACSGLVPNPLLSFETFFLYLRLKSQRNWFLIKFYSLPK